MIPVAPHPESDGIRGPEGDATPVALRPAIPHRPTCITARSPKASAC